MLKETFQPTVRYSPYLPPDLNKHTTKHFKIIFMRQLETHTLIGHLIIKNY